ncbi:polymorphic toxin type 28 domain-containing protein [Streptomyces sp. NBRC 109706]|uniref:polymorphic toxin type 28 domain-containing protein n=1 Tax=Streptomyces sp. NBRC 109706 TaxID=1550035 RepID=UPI00078345E6|nr:polymorphic toxin type 28 domain-containing protein [Streptomyces sp. NBRC 109706]
MVRAFDWSPVDMDRDPTPGDPDEVRELADDLQEFADDVGEALGKIRGLASERAVLDWAGLSADAFRTEFDGVPDNLTKLEESYSLCAQALHTYWPKLQTAQGMADRALDRAVSAQADLNSAQSALGDATDWVGRAGEEAERLQREGEREDVEPPDEADVRSAARDQQAAEAAAGAARSRVNDAEERLSAARQLALDAQEMREEAARECARDVDAASDAGIQNRRWWEKAIKWVTDNWDTLVEICKVIVAVLGIVVMIIGGPLAWVVLAAALVVLTDTLIKYARGEAGLLDVAFAALDCIPGMKGLTTLGGLARGLRGGLSAARTGLRAYAGNLRNLGQMWQLDGIRGIGKVLVGDPIDIATGEMTLRHTDVQLPGVLPLLLEREHLSAYRDGRWFGASWASTLDQRLVLGEFGADFFAADGMRLHYPVPLADPETPVLPVTGPRWGLSWDGQGGGDFMIHQPASGHTLHFAPVSGQPNVELPLTAITDRNANRIDILYDEETAVPREVLHSSGYRVGVAVQNGRVTALSLLSAPGQPLLRAFEYDVAGNLAKVFDSSGMPLTFDYDDQHRMIRWQDRNDTWYAYTYDGAGRCVHTTGTDRVLEYRYVYEEEHLRTTTINSLGHRTVYQLNDRYRLVSTTDPAGHTTHQEWDDSNRLVAITDPLGRVRRHEYDQDDNVTTIVLPLGNRVFCEYNALGCLTAVVHEDGTSWSFEYDAAGNCTSALDAAGRRTRYAYDAHGGITGITDALGEETRIRRDAAGLLREAIDPAGSITTITRDSFGRPVWIFDSRVGETGFEWSTDGHLLRRSSSTGTSETYERDPEGNLLTHTDGDGRVTSFTYGPFDLPISHTTPDGATHSFERDTELRLVQVTNPLDQSWRYDYAPNGWLNTETDFGGRTTTYEHDAAGQLTRRVNAAGQSVDCVYDAQGLLTRRISSGGEVTTFIRDSQGRVIRATSPGVELTRSYNACGELLSETVNGLTLTLTHDPRGKLSERITPSGHLSTWTYDAAGRPLRLVSGGHPIEFTYDATGRESSRALASEMTLTRYWDAAGRLSRQSVVGPGEQMLTSRGYHYRSDGNLTELDDLATGHHRFDLDPIGRVLALTGPGERESYGYDALGNQTDAQWPTGLADTDVTGERHYHDGTLVRAGRVRYAYDEAGRTVQRQRTRLSKKPGTWQYAWDADDRLIRTETPDGTVWTYLYDPFGRRVAKERHDADGLVVERTMFSWHGTTLVETTNTTADGAEITLTWDHDGNHPLTQNEARSLDQNEIDRRFFGIVTDLVGTPTHLVGDDARTHLAWQPSTLWGNSRLDSADTSSTPLRFPGQYADEETGWFYNFHRHYDPAIGRYTSPDPLGLEPSPNPYSYPVNPFTWLDPLGLSAHPMRRLGLSSTADNAIQKLHNILEDPVGAINSQPGHNHYSAARREAGGEVVAVRPDGTPFDHVADLTQGRNGLNNIRRALEREMQNPPDSMTDRGLDVLVQKHKETVTELDRLNGFLHQIQNQ